MSEVANIPNNIRRYVGGFVARRRRAALLRSAGIALLFAILWLLAGSMLDRFFPLPSSVRLMLLASNVIVIVLLMSRPIAAIVAGRFDWRIAAAQIEQRDPRFIGRLETAISQLMLPENLRGSSPMLDTIVEQADTLAGKQLSLPLVPMEPALRPWLMALAAALLMAMLAFSPWLDLPQLLHRALEPLGGAGPVTTTRLSVETGNSDVPQGESVIIVARAQRLRDAELTIHLSSDNGASELNGANESNQAMVLDGQGRFSFVLNAVDRDWQYQITGGDARSPLYAVRVLRHPAIAEFHVRYIYPPYTAMEPASETNRDGALKAPAGTQAMVDLVSTEPLQSAAMIVNGQRFEARAIKQANTYEASIPITQSGPYQIELRSARGVANGTGEGTAGLTIQAIADQPPQPRWEFAAQNLFLTAEAVANLRYQVSDDYGAGSISLEIDVPNQPPRRIPQSDSTELLKDQHGEAALHLSEIHANSGDLLAARIVATDAAGQSALSPPINLIIAPHSIDAEDGLRIASLNAAAKLAQSLEDVSADALRSEDDSQRSGRPDPAPRNSRMIRASVLAGQVANELTRAIAHTDSASLSAGLMELVDRAVICQAHSKPFVPSDDPSAAQTQHDWLAQIADQSHHLRSDIESLRAGETAVMAMNALEDFQSLLPLTSNHEQPRSVMLREALQQAGRDVDDALKGIGIDPDDQALEELLAGKIAGRDESLRAISPDSDPVTRLQNTIASGAVPRDEAVARLLTMARAEVVRPDADYARAASLTSAAAGQNDPMSRQIESLVMKQASQIVANDFAAADQTDRLIHQTATSKPSADVAMLLPQIDRAAERELARAKATKASTRQAARLRIRSLPEIAALLGPTSEQSTGGELANDHFTTTASPGQSQTISGYDEPLRIYFQALRRTQ